MLKTFFTSIILPFFIISGIYAQPSSINKNWWVQASDSVKVSGKIISQETYAPTGWLNARIPRTVMAVLIDNGLFPRIYQSKNLANVNEKLFANAWWYRTSIFISPADSAKHKFLKLHGINYRANIWLNGKLVASADTLMGTYRVFEFPITKFLKNGNNMLAIQVFPPKPGDFTTGFVDWNPAPPDRNMGIWRAVELIVTGNSRIMNPVIRTKFNDPKAISVDVEVEATLVNLTSDSLPVEFRFRQDSIYVNTKLVLKPREKRLMVLTSQDFPQLSFYRPALWWPHTLGKPSLHHCATEILSNGKVSEKIPLRYGIKQINDYFTTNGNKGYAINGKKFQVRGAGFTDEIFLTDTEDKTRTQLQYAMAMNLNTLRLEGFAGNSDYIYQMADSMGIMIMPGFSCQWEWDYYLGKKTDDFGGVKSKGDMNLTGKYLHDQILQLRNHPCVLTYVLASDKLPRPKLEELYRNVAKTLDNSRPVLSSCSNRKSELSGITGVKMTGPYQWVPPVYWYADTKNGGAWGFNTETGLGAMLPPASSIRNMLGRESWWPIDSTWMFHMARGDFREISTFNTPLEKRYGEFTDLDTYAEWAQVMQFECVRPMYEAYALNQPEATGLIFWKLNNAWPGMYWQLFDFYGHVGGAFYGVRNALSFPAVLFNYQTHEAIYFNDTDLPLTYKARIRVLNTDASVHMDTTFTIEAYRNKQRIMNMKNLLAQVPNAFINFQLTDTANHMVSNKWYWHSNVPDEPDFAKTTWKTTPTQSYAQFLPIRQMPMIKPVTEFKFERMPESLRLDLTITNPGPGVLFFGEAAILASDNVDSRIPSVWTDNYITLAPGETTTISTFLNYRMQPEAIRFKATNTDEVILRLRQRR